MKNLKMILIPLIAYGCTSEAPEFNFAVSIVNESGNTLTVSALNFDNEIVFQQILNEADSSQKCTYLSETFGGFSCSIDSVSIVFENGKGYACDVRSNDIGVEYCFSEKNPFSGPDSFRNLGNNRYEFIITEEDFNNAHELPE